jgi:hypothetical protein
MVLPGYFEQFSQPLPLHLLRFGQSERSATQSRSHLKRWAEFGQLALDHERLYAANLDPRRSFFLLNQSSPSASFFLLYWIKRSGSPARFRTDVLIHGPRAGQRGANGCYGPLQSARSVPRLASKSDPFAPQADS